MSEQIPNNERNVDESFESKFMNYFNRQVAQKVDELDQDPAKVIDKGQKSREAFMKDHRPKLKNKKFHLALLYI